MNAPFAPDAPSAVPQRVRLTPAVLAQAESFIAKHEPDAVPTPLHAVGDRVTATLVGKVLQSFSCSDGERYRVEFETLNGVVGLTVPAFRLSAMEGV